MVNYTTKTKKKYSKEIALAVKGGIFNLKKNSTISLDGSVNCIHNGNSCNPLSFLADIYNSYYQSYNTEDDDSSYNF